MAGEDLDYVFWIKMRPCAAQLIEGCGDCNPVWPCDGHHAGQRGLGQRAHDHTCVPLCRLHHTAWHDAHPPFRGWNANKRREWSAVVIAENRELYLLVRGPNSIPF